MRRVIGVLLGLLFALSPVLGAPPTPDPGLTADELATLQAQEQAVLAELFTLNREQERTEAELDRLAQEQASTRHLVAETQAKISQTESTLAGLKERLAGRLRLLQERGQFNPFAALMGADSLTTFLSRLESVNLLISHERRLMAQVSSTQQALTRQRTELQQTEARLGALAEAAMTAQAKLSAEIAQRESILAGLQTKRERIESALAQLEGAWAQVDALLAALAEEISASTAKADGFEPDEVTLSLFPPGATAVVSDATLNRLISGGLSFAFEPAGARLQGRLAGVEFLLQGNFAIIDGRLIRFAPTEMRLDGLPIPPDVVGEAVAKSPIQIDLGRWIQPFRLLELTPSNGMIRVRSGL